LYSLTFSQ
jgi:pimeloyl-ACP methyl ester carboxylesterase